MSNNPLGKQTPYPNSYAPDVLCPIPRSLARQQLGIGQSSQGQKTQRTGQAEQPTQTEQPQPPMHGLDHWHAYELSWLTPSGRPAVAIAEFFFNANSENLIESKSLKLYLNSLNNEVYANTDEVTKVITQDLSHTSAAPVKVQLNNLTPQTPPPPITRRGQNLDELEPHANENDTPAASLVLTEDKAKDLVLYSDLFKSNCPVTGQPDWASVKIRYSGSRIDESTLLAYLLSYRNHRAYHEACGEQIFHDLYKTCRPTHLWLALNFLRRGGLDINVYRSTEPITPDMLQPRLARQ